MRRVTITCFVAALLLFAAPAAAGALSFDEAVDQLVSQGYPDSVVAQIRAHGSTALGFWPGGTPADDRVAKYIAKQMRAADLKQVRREYVPVDEWNMKGAWVRVAGRKLTASQWGGVRGTPARGLTGELVYVGLGSAEEFATAGNVRGKVVLMDLDSYSWWSNFPQMEARLAGVKAIVLTHAPYDTDPSAEYFTQMDALGAFDAETDYANTPLVYVSRRDGEWLRGQLVATRAAPLKATVTSLVDVRMANRGGHGWNVVGEIRGTSAKRQMVIISAHHDAWFRPAMDDTSAVAAALTMAKALKMSGYKPDRTLVFLVTTAEEFGYTDAWYDWLVGAWYSITRTHRDWPGKVAGQLNLEWQGLKEGWYQVRTNPEMKPWLEALFASHPELAPYGVEPGIGVRNKVYCWNDQWPFTAAGVPSVYLATKSDTYRGQWYHTQYDRPELIDWEYFAKNVKLAALVAMGLDKPVDGILPYDFKARADQLAGTVDAAALKAEGVDAGKVDAFMSDLAAYAAAASAFQARKGAIDPADKAVTNRRLLQVEKWLNSSMTALDQWDTTVYPHQQVVWDLEYVNDAIDSIDAANKTAALTAVEGVGQAWIAKYFSPRVYLRHLRVISPGYRRITWGGQGHVAPYPRVDQEMDLIGAGRLAEARPTLVTKRDKLRAAVAERLADMGMALHASTAELVKLTP